MKKVFRLIVAIYCACLLLLQQNCSNANVATATGELSLKKYLDSQFQFLDRELEILSTTISNHQIIEDVKTAFANSRFQYKMLEPIVEYYFQGLTKRINGPALPDVKTEDGQVFPAQGFQVIEQLIFDTNNDKDTISPAVFQEIKRLQTDLKFVQSNLASMSILPHQLDELIQHELIRIAVLGIAGFDAPLSQYSLQECAAALKGMGVICQHYGKGNRMLVSNQQLNDAIVYLEQNNDFNQFDRLHFITKHLMPLSQSIPKTDSTENFSDSNLQKPFYGTLFDLLAKNRLNANYFCNYAIGNVSAAKIAVGEKLFYEKALSKNGAMSCASCHQADQYFTDGKIKASDFVHGGNLARNTPSLYYAAFQNAQFYDLRSATLEDQIDAVFKNQNEFATTPAAMTKALLKDSIYQQLLMKAYGNKDSLTDYHLRNAIAVYVRSLMPFQSRFDQYLKSPNHQLDSNEILGFNLFMGKGKCGTCHFMPVFNGTVPPFYTKSESEVIGVPAKAVWQKASIDQDKGRFHINEISELKYAFKTPTVRNAAKTAPYMHNGVYKTLDDVVEFYHRGGGEGIGIAMDNQSLPFDQLNLTSKEKKAIVQFLHALTDEVVVKETVAKRF
jgi:cytochrome c peroxidase